MRAYPGVEALRPPVRNPVEPPTLGAQAQRLRNWAASQQAATAANAWNGDFLNQPSDGPSPTGMPLPHRLPDPPPPRPPKPAMADGSGGPVAIPTDDLRSAPPVKPGMPAVPELMLPTPPPDKRRLTGRRY